MVEECRRKRIVRAMARSEETAFSEVHSIHSLSSLFRLPFIGGKRKGQERERGMIEIVDVVTDNEISEARHLFLEYAASLGFSLCFQGFDQEVRDLPGSYAPPHGVILAAKEGEQVVGCAAMRPLDPGVCEMKRLFVRPQFRGKGLGRLLAKAIVTHAQAQGYRSMRLDTLETMKEAMALYQSLGFRQIQPYYDNPLPGALYFELRIVGDL